MDPYYATCHGTDSGQPRSARYECGTHIDDLLCGGITDWDGRRSVDHGKTPIEWESAMGDIGDINDFGFIAVA